MNSTAKTSSLARALALGLLSAVVLAAPLGAVERVLKLEVQPRAAAGETVKATVRASTDAGAGEQIGFLHAEVSIDGGKTWTGLCYEQNQGASAVRHLTFKVGTSGAKALVRVRAAYRGGPAGDVDFAAGAIKWQGSWATWGEPPARSASVDVAP